MLSILALDLHIWFYCKNISGLEKVESSNEHAIIIQSRLYCWWCIIYPDFLYIRNGRVNAKAYRWTFRESVPRDCSATFGLYCCYYKKVLPFLFVVCFQCKLQLSLHFLLHGRTAMELCPIVLSCPEEYWIGAEVRGHVIFRKLSEWAA
jgi:hypothetical protein